MFTKVQFMGVALCTTPANLTSIGETSDDGYYAGLPDDGDDLSARVSLIKQAIQTTYRSAQIDLSKDTLKVFVLPEFLMRGAAGAYYSSLPYSAESILVREFKDALQDLAGSGMEFGSDSLFVLGTVLSTSDKIDYTKEPGASLYRTGDNLLDLFYHLHPRDNACQNSALFPQTDKISGILKMLDGKLEKMPVTRMGNAAENSLDDAYIDVLKKSLEYCDTQASIEIENRCLVISGADILSEETGLLSTSAYEPIIVQKQYKSKEDFILNYSNSSQVTNAPKYLQTTTKYCNVDNSEGETKQHPSDGLAIFEYEGLKIGIDICLDHSRQRLVKHLYSHPNDYVDLQIVTSCGMSVRSTSVIAKAGGIVFNCDGEYELHDVKAGVDGKCCHTSLQRVRQRLEIQGKNVLSGAVLEDASAVKETIPCKEDKSLYRFEDFQIHIYDPMELK